MTKTTTSPKRVPTSSSKTVSPRSTHPSHSILTNLRPIRLAVAKNALLESVLAAINNDTEIKTLWRIVNTHAIKRLGMTDHGPIHFQIVASNSLQLLRLLREHKVQPSIVTDFGMSFEHAEVVVTLASLFHDLGMSVHRRGHEEFSLFITHALLKKLLAFLPEEEQTILSSEVLHAIISHRRNGIPLTIEAGVVRVADALDMAKGRSRIPYQAGKIDIHSVSAMAIDEVTIKQGKKTPIQVNIIMNHTAGIFQVDELLKEKIKDSGIEHYLEMKIYMDKGTGKQLFTEFYKKKNAPL